MTHSNLSREVSSSGRRRDRAVLSAFVLSWLATLSLAVACYTLIRDNRSLRSDVVALESEVSLTHTLVVLERARGHERQLQMLAELADQPEAPPVVASAEPEEEETRRRPRGSNRHRDGNRDGKSSGDRVVVDCQGSDDPLCGLGTTRSLR